MIYFSVVLSDIQINAHYYLHPYFNINAPDNKTIDLVDYGGLWPACGGGKSGGGRGR